MKRKKLLKTTIKLLIILLVLLMFILVVISNEYNIGKKETISKIEIPTEQISAMSILYSINHKKVIEDVDVIVLYNTVFTPIDTTLKAIFNDEYLENTNQTLKSGSQELVINFEKNEIIIPYDYTYGSYNMDNSVMIEIEEYNNNKYIPLYLISNLDNTIVKLDDVEIYNNHNYVSSVDVIKKNNGKHSIEINLGERVNKNEAYIGQALGSLWREEALKRIEKYRKKEISIIVKNQNNKILKNASAQIEMTSNEFEFGTAINYTGKINNYDKIEKQLFNILGSENSLKWKYFHYDRATDIETYALSNGMTTRGHCLWWDIIFSDELRKLVGNTDNPSQETMAYIYNNYKNGMIGLDKAEDLSKKIQKEFEQLVLNHIEEEINLFPGINEWDVVNEILRTQFFKIYLYDRVLLTDGGFLEEIQPGNPKSYTDNEEYYRFLAKCFNKAREIKKNGKLVLNDNIIDGNNQGLPIQNDIRAIKNIINYTNNIDALGIQYHVSNKYHYSPQSYYNNINRVLNETGIKEAVITEYDNYTAEKKGKYTAEERQLKADYLRDTLIMAYSNPNISEFCFWVYNSDRFDDEEREAYEEFVIPLLNYTEQGVSDENGYTTRLYKGSYTATVTLPNGEKKTVSFDVSDDASDIIEIVYTSELDSISIEKLPDNLVVFKGYELNLNGGIIYAHYDDGTTEEIAMNDNTKVNVSGFNKNTLGQQTITLTYENKSVSLEVNVIEDMTSIINNIKNSNNKLSQSYSNVFSNAVVKSKYDALFTLLNNIMNDSRNNSINRIETALNAQFEVLDSVLKEYNNGNINLTTAELTKLIQDLISTAEDYKPLYTYYLKQEPDNINENAKNALNALIDIYNDNSNIGIAFLRPVILEERNVYQNELLTDDMANNYLNKMRIIKSSNILSNFIDEFANKTVDKEKDAAMLSTSYKVNEEYITRIDKNTKVKDLTKELSMDNGYKIIRNGKEIQSSLEKIATGDILQVGNKNYTLVVTGDINCDGNCSIKDLIIFRNYLLNAAELTEAQEKAADIKEDNRLNIKDLIYIRTEILK